MANLRKVTYESSVVADLYHTAKSHSVSPSSGVLRGIHEFEVRCVAWDGLRCDVRGGRGKGGETATLEQNEKESVCVRDRERERKSC